MTTISQGHIFGVHHWRKRKFGPSTRASWLAFEEWMREIIGRVKPIDQLTEDQAVRLIDAMRALPDYGQGVLGMEI